jgi:hypothetical protein
MAYEIEDEVDWSDSPLGPPSPEANRAAENLNGTQPAVEKPGDDHDLFVSENVDRCEIAPGSPLAFSRHISVDTKAILAHMSQHTMPTRPDSRYPLVPSGLASAST